MAEKVKENLTRSTRPFLSTPRDESGLGGSLAEEYNKIARQVQNRKAGRKGDRTIPNLQ